MVWRTYITDAHDGTIITPIDLPSFTWSMTVNDSSLSTTPSKEVGVDDVSGITVPWNAVPGDTQREKYEAIESGRKAIALFWCNDDDLRDSTLGTPVLWGVVGAREDSWDSTTFNLDSVKSILANRFLVREGRFNNGTSTDTIRFSGMSMRGIASEVGYLCTNAKPGGSLPVDWAYRGEKHTPTSGQSKSVHERNYQAWNVSNLSGSDVFDKLAGVEDGVDMQWRPYLTEAGNAVRMMFVAGTDEQKYLGQKGVYGFSCYPGGGTFENLKVTYQQPMQRVYATGSGQDAATLTAFAQDLTLVERSNPYMLMEAYYGDTDVDNVNLLRQHAQAQLSALSTPIMQMVGEYNLGDRHVPQLGEIWPGEIVQLALQGHPALPDGVYQQRIMEMSGDSANTVKIVFDVMTVPYF